MHVTQLARGAINGADEITVELRQPDNDRAVVFIIWPTQPTVCSPERLSATISAAMAVLARAATAYTRRKARKYL
jgi:hypothetical protein